MCCSHEAHLRHASGPPFPRWPNDSGQQGLHRAWGHVHQEPRDPAICDGFEVQADGVKRPSPLELRRGLKYMPRALCKFGKRPSAQLALNGDEVSGVTTMQMDVGLDTGDILDTVEVRLDPKETGGSLFDRLSLAGGKLILSTLEKAEAGILHPVKQDEAEATHVTMLDKSMGQIDWSMDAAVIERLIRGLNPWPSAYTKFEGKTLKIWSADVEEDAAGRPSPETFGQVVRVGKDAFSVQTGKGLLTIRELQLEGKKRMDTAAFLRGYPVETGVKLG